MNVLSIAGSDPSGGAGIQRDLQVIGKLGLHGLSVITAVTSQNTRKFYRAEPVSAKSVSAQLGAVLDDFEISAIKIGMVHSSAVMRAVEKRLDGLNCPVIVDPVIRSTTSGALLPMSAVAEFRKRIIPLAHIITPNVYECGVLSAKRGSKNSPESSAAALISMGAVNVVVTGVSSGDKINDCVFGEKNFIISRKKLSGENHGGGCTFSSALTGYISLGQPFEDAVRNAGEFAQRFVKNAEKIGKGFSIAGSGKSLALKDKLADAISEFVRMQDAYRMIPECQTNFVYARPDPETIDDVFGIRGRIVRTGKTVAACGTISAGGSRHVASAVVQMCKKFPQTRSAVNIRYSEALVEKIKNAGMTVAAYDRTKEPAKLKKSQSGSVPWGVRAAIKGAKSPPDAIYHTGDYGKEAMILVFGQDPTDVLKKMARVFG